MYQVYLKCSCIAIARRMDDLNCLRLRVGKYPWQLIYLRTKVKSREDNRGEVAQHQDHQKAQEIHKDDMFSF